MMLPLMRRDAMQRARAERVREAHYDA